MYEYGLLQYFCYRVFFFLAETWLISHWWFHFLSSSLHTGRYFYLCKRVLKMKYVHSFFLEPIDRALQEFLFLHHIHRWWTVLKKQCFQEIALSRSISSMDDNNGQKPFWASCKLWQCIAEVPLPGWPHGKSCFHRKGTSVAQGKNL